MAKFDINEAIEQSTQDGKLDAKSLMGLIDEQYVNPIVAKNKPSQDKIVAEYKNKWIESLGFENVKDEAQLKAFVKTTANEWQEKYNTLKTDLDKYSDYDTLKQQNSMYGNYSLLRNEGLTDNDQIEFLEFKINKQEGETFADKLTAYKTTHPDTFQKAKVTTGVKISTKIPEGEKLGFEKELERMGKL